MTAHRPLGRVIPAAELAIRIEADQVLDAARAEAAAIRAAARKEGVEQGRSEGAAAMTRLLAETAARMRAEAAALEPALAEAIADGVARVIGGLPVAERVAAAAAIAVSELSARSRITLRVHPAAADRVRAEVAPMVETLVLLADATLAEDDCIVESTAGSIAAGIAPQLAALRAALAP
jgi:type III secretion protein L